MSSLNKAGGRTWGLLLIAGLVYPQLAGAATLPGINLSQYCANTYGSGAYATLLSGQNNAYGWTCVSGGQNKSMDLNAACSQQHPGSYGAAYYDFNNPYSWYCQFKTTYVTQAGNSRSMFVWRGDYVALMTPDVTTCSPPEAITIVTAVDKGFKFYSDVTGQTPPLNKHYNNKDALVAVPAADGPTCGGSVANACGLIGVTGIEFQLAGAFTSMCAAARTSPVTHDQTPYYELGRNFFFYSNQLSPGSTLTKHGVAMRTGYAVAMRFLAMEYSGLNGANMGTNSFANVKKEVKKLVDTYRSSNATCGSGTTTTPYPGSSTNCYTYDWTRTLKNGTTVTNPYSLQNTDLLASFVLRLHRVHGRTFLDQLWRKVALRPSASTDEDAARNFIVAASQAAGVNLADVFQYEWRWPVDTATRNLLQSSLGSPVSSSAYITPEPP